MNKIKYCNVIGAKKISTLSDYEKEIIYSIFNVKENELEVLYDAKKCSASSFQVLYKIDRLIDNLRQEGKSIEFLLSMPDIARHYLLENLNFLETNLNSIVHFSSLSEASLIIDNIFFLHQKFPGYKIEHRFNILPLLIRTLGNTYCELIPGQKRKYRGNINDNLLMPVVKKKIFGLITDIYKQIKLLPNTEKYNHSMGLILKNCFISGDLQLEQELLRLIVDCTYSITKSHEVVASLANSFVFSSDKNYQANNKLPSSMVKNYTYLLNKWPRAFLENKSNIIAGLTNSNKEDEFEIFDALAKSHINCAHFYNDLEINAIYGRLLKGTSPTVQEEIIFAWPNPEKIMAHFDKNPLFIDMKSDDRIRIKNLLNIRLQKIMLLEQIKKTTLTYNHNCNKAGDGINVARRGKAIDSLDGRNISLNILANISNRRSKSNKI